MFLFEAVTGWHFDAAMVWITAGDLALLALGASLKRLGRILASPAAFLSLFFVLVLVYFALEKC